MCGREFWHKNTVTVVPEKGARHGEISDYLSKSPIERSIRIPQDRGFVKTKTTKYWAKNQNRHYI
jgi:hypothetical protein